MKIHLYHICKACSYRVLAVLCTVSLVYIFTGQLKLAGIIGGIEIVLKLILYYTHEIIWEKIMRKKFKGEKE